MENEFGEEISDSRIDDITKRIMALSRKNIDELYYSLGFIVSNHEPENKALRNIDLDAYTKSMDTARDKVKTLISETPFSKLKSALSEIEKKSQKK